MKSGSQGSCAIFNMAQCPLTWYFCHKNQPLEEVQIFIHETFFLVELKQVPPAAAAATLENLGEARASYDSLSFVAASQRWKNFCSLAKRPTLTEVMRQERFPFGWKLDRFKMMQCGWFSLVLKFSIWLIITIFIQIKLAWHPSNSLTNTPNDSTRRGTCIIKFSAFVHLLLNPLIWKLF